MNRIFRRIVNHVMSAFVGSGIRIGDEGELCLPDGLTPDRVHRFVDLVTDERHDSPRAAMHSLFARLGVSERAMLLLGQIIDSQGDVEFAVAAKHIPALMAAIPDFQQIPVCFRDFLVCDLGIASDACQSLEAAVESTRLETARRIGCAATWDEILRYDDVISEIARPWLERQAAA